MVSHFFNHMITFFNFQQKSFQNTFSLEVLILLLFFFQILLFRLEKVRISLFYIVDIHMTSLALCPA